MPEPIEYEGKLLQVDIGKLKAALTAANATALPPQNFRRYVFDTIPATPSRWVRLRTDGSKATLAVKQINSDETDGTNEWETSVGDIDTTLAILEKIGITPRGYQENKRESFTLPLGEVSIDYWPSLEPYAEFEAKDKASLEALVSQLGYNPDDLVGINTEKLYEAIGVDLQKTAELKF